MVAPGRRARQGRRPRGVPLPLPALRRQRLRLRAQHRARRHEAEDVTQHVFAKLMTVIGKYEPRDVPFSAWILRVARNVAIDHMRQRRAIPCEEVRELEPPRRGRPPQRSLSLREALAHAARGPARGRRPAPRRRPHARRDRRPASARPSRPSTACTTAAAARCATVLAEMRVRAHRRREGGCADDPRSAQPVERIPHPRLDQADPELLEELLEVVAASPRAGAFTMGAELEAFEAEFADVLRDRRTPSASPPAPRRSSLALRALGIGPATRSSSPPTRSSRPPRP